MSRVHDPVSDINKIPHFATDFCTFAGQMQTRCCKKLETINMLSASCSHPTTIAQMMPPTRSYIFIGLECFIVPFSFFDRLVEVGSVFVIIDKSCPDRGWRAIGGERYSNWRQSRRNAKPTGDPFFIYWCSGIVLTIARSLLQSESAQ